MKTCNTCKQEYSDQFSFCPVDATALSEMSDAADTKSAFVSPEANSLESTQLGQPEEFELSRSDYSLTIVEDAGLTYRLREQLREAAAQLRAAWPEFKEEPLQFAARSARFHASATWKFLSSPNVTAGIMTAIFVVVSIIAGIVILERFRLNHKNDQFARNENRDDLVLTQMVPAEEDLSKPDKGIGVNGAGRVGANKGTGEGSGPQPKKSSGGGGGGQNNTLPAQQGKLPPTSSIPSFIPTIPPARQPLLPTAGIDLDPALNKDLPYTRYGDPTSKSTATSGGPGTGGGIGDGNGTGINNGEGPGMGPGNGGNTGGNNKDTGCCGPGGTTGDNLRNTPTTYRPNEVSQRAKILSKPEPQYTEDARKNQVTGTVILKAILSSTGEVTSIKAVSPLSFGLTEKAIAAARMIKFLPAVKDGHTVSQYIQIEYNFNLY